MPAKVEPIELAALLDRVKDQTGMSGSRPDVSVGCRCTSELWINADPQRLELALSNLVENAMKFSPPGGSVEMAASVEQDGSIAISVMGRGFGVPQAHLGRLRACLDGGDVRDLPGEGKIGVGSKFRFGLILPAPEASQLSRPASASLAGRRLVVIDGCLNSCEGIVASLTQDACEIAIADKWAAAVPLLGNADLLLVSCDAVDDALVGKIAALRQNGNALCGVVVNAVTSSIGDAATLERAGAQGCMSASLDIEPSSVPCCMTARSASSVW